LPKVEKKRAPSPSPKGAAPGTDLLEEIEALSSELCAGTQDSHTVLNTLAQRLVSRYGTSVCGLWKVDESGQLLELTAQAGRPEFPSQCKRTSVKETILGKAVRHRLPQLAGSSDGPADGLMAWAKQYNLKFLAAYPLLDNSKPAGAMLVACSRPPSKSVLSLYRLHAQMGSMALREASLLESTQRTLSKLSFMVEASKALNSTLDLSELLGRILEVAKSQVEAERGTLFLVDEKAHEIWSLIAHGLEKQEIRLPLGKGIAGHVAQSGEIVLIPDAYADPRFNPEVDKRTGFRTRNILCLPIRNKGGQIIAALQLLNKKQGVFTSEDADFLLTLSGHMALALENAQLHQELLEKERMEKELALARGIQRSLLPETAPLVEGLDIALLNEPCFAVGGDYYDFLSLGPNTFLSVIADVEGKGVSSALVMSNLQATLRALVLHLHSLDEIAESLNRMILNDTRSQKYLSIFLGLIDIRRKGLHYINCGHVPPVIVRTGSDPVALTEGGMVIGLFESARFERGYTRLQRGDVLVLCTDGITESMDAQHEEYGTDRLVECVRTVQDKSAAEIVSAVSADVTRFSRYGAHTDDKVMIAIKVN
jgi:sigma-B regulation protein RsbU (phosphoserine phosphatase)